MWCILSPTEFWSRFIRTSWTWFLSAIVWFPMRVACRTRYWRRRFWPASHMFGLTYQYSCFVRSGGCLLPSTFLNGYCYQNFNVHFCIDIAFLDLSLHMYPPVTALRMFMFSFWKLGWNCQFECWLWGGCFRVSLLSFFFFFFCKAFWVSPHTRYETLKWVRAGCGMDILDF